MNNRYSGKIKHTKDYLFRTNNNPSYQKRIMIYFY